MQLIGHLIERGGQEADFIPRFLKGSMRYWMEGIPAEPMIAFYARSDRSVWAQELDLMAPAIIERLGQLVGPGRVSRLRCVALPSRM